ncbi:MAG: YciI family protein [Kiloniellales bacterium]
MHFVVVFEDNPDRAGERSKHMPAHLAFLAKNETAVQAAGPLTDSSDGQAAGGLWLVEAGDAAEVEALVRSDPLFATGLRRSWRVLSWHQVFADGQAL